MNFDQETADMVSANLLQIKAIKLNNGLPFTWASGLKSPIYCDNRITLSYPKTIGESHYRAIWKCGRHCRSSHCRHSSGSTGSPGTWIAFRVCTVGGQR